MRATLSLIILFLSVCFRPLALELDGFDVGGLGEEGVRDLREKIRTGSVRKK
jgi:hypothetical protein